MMAIRARKRPVRIALLGNPNTGKSTLFNRLTGLRQHIANYPGITVEKKTGALVLGGQQMELLDLPGAYSLAAASPDADRGVYGVAGCCGVIGGLGERNENRDLILGFRCVVSKTAPIAGTEIQPSASG